MRFQDTITGFLLAGVGNVDLRKKRNYLVVDSSEIVDRILLWHLQPSADTVVLARATETSVRVIEQAFKEFAARDDIAVILISQQVAGQIRHIISQHNKVRWWTGPSSRRRVVTDTSIHLVHPFRSQFQQCSRFRARTARMTRRKTRSCGE